MKVLLLCSFLTFFLSINADANDSVYNQSIKKEMKQISATHKELKKVRKDALKYLDGAPETKRLTQMFELLSNDPTYSQYSKEDLATIIIIITM